MNNEEEKKGDMVEIKEKAKEEEEVNINISVRNQSKKFHHFMNLHSALYNTLQMP